MSIDVDKEKIEEVLTRSISHIFPSQKSLQERLFSGKRMKIYHGIDATGPELHIGHATNFIVLEKLRQLGHEVVILFGDFTAMIGDPTDKDATRKQLSPEEVEKNIKTWKEQINKIVDLNNKENPASIQKNSVWLSKLQFKDVVGLAAHFTVQQMIERDMFEKRLTEHKPIGLHEFLYPLMQGYDSVALDADMEVGGNDQIFNMCIGRTLQKRYNDKEKFILATTLLENPKTKKKLMSKSEGSYIALSDSPKDMFGKIMALPDEAILPVFMDSTHVPMKEIEEMKKEIQEGANPRDIKMRLAHEITLTYHDKKEADYAKENFINTFQKKEAPEEAKEIIVSKGEKLRAVLLREGFIQSHSDFRRLVREGAVCDCVTNEKITDADFVPQKNTTFKIGKHRFVSIRIK